MTIENAKYWIDTDPGVDDAVAIILAIREVGRQLVGISTVQGNFPEHITARNLARVLQASRVSGVAPSDWNPTIARGSSVSFLGNCYAGDPKDAYHGHDGLANVPWEPNADWDCRATPIAAQAIIDSAIKNPGLRLLLIGPLTNLALAIRLAPELPKLIGSVAIMGGSLRAGGNETMAAEFNFAVDAEAAQIVLQAGFEDIRLVPIDACDDAKLSLNDLHRLSTINSPAARLVSELVMHWKDQLLAGRSIPVYDAVAWIAWNYPALAKWESVYVAIDTGHGLAHGASIPDWRNKTKKASNVKAATGIKDSAKFFDLFFHLLS